MVNKTKNKKFAIVPESSISGWQLYLTRREDVARFFKEIKPANSKHLERYKKFKAQVVP